MSGLEAWLTARLSGFNPWTNVYGLARSLIAGSAALTLLLNPTSYLFRPFANVLDHPPICHEMTKLSLYCLGGDGSLELKRWVAIALLLVVASGWRPRLTGVLHWWLVLSYQLATMAVEGGDQVALGLSLLLIPITLLDRRKWHWNAPRPASDPPELPELKRRLVGWVMWGVIRVQVALIYLHASVGKASNEHWMDGTAVYYWFHNPVFGAPGWLSPITDPLVANAYTLGIMTWGTMVLEIMF